MNYCDKYNIDTSNWILKGITKTNKFGDPIKCKRYIIPDDGIVFVTGEIMTQNYLVEYYNKNNCLHRDFEPAVIRVKNGKLVECRYKQNGVSHREDGPSDFCFTSNEDYTIEAWMRNGKFVRFDGPAYIETDVNTNEIKKQSFFINDVCYKEEDYWKLINSIKEGNGRGIGNCKEPKLKILLQIAKFYKREDLIEKINKRFKVLKLNKK